VGSATRTDRGGCCLRAPGQGDPVRVPAVATRPAVGRGLAGRLQRAGAARVGRPTFPGPATGLLLTMIVVDDILALVVIATVYTRRSNSPHCLQRSRSSPAWSPSESSASWGLDLPSARGRGVGGSARIRRGAGHRRTCHGPADLRDPQRPQAGDRAVPRVPRATNRRTRPLGRAGCAIGSVTGPDARSREPYLGTSWGTT